MSDALTSIKLYTRKLVRESQSRKQKTVEDRIESLFNALYGEKDTHEPKIERVQESPHIEEFDYKDFVKDYQPERKAIKRNHFMPMQKSTRPRRSTIR